MFVVTDCICCKSASVPCEMLNVTTSKLEEIYSSLVCRNCSVLSPELRWLGREADHSPPSCAEVTAWCYISSPHMSFSRTQEKTLLLHLNSYKTVNVFNSIWVFNTMKSEIRLNYTHKSDFVSEKTNSISKAQTSWSLFIILVPSLHNIYKNRCIITVGFMFRPLPGHRHANKE